jgi:translation elongation factor EF-G
MGVRVLCPAAQLKAMKDDLMARAAKIYDAEVSPPIGVVRATVALARLLGYSQYLSGLTGGKAREVVWLSHYAPVEPVPPDGCAA